MPRKSAGGISKLTDLVPAIRKSPGFSEVVTALGDRQSATIDGAWGSACALAASAIAEDCPGTLLVVLPRLADVEHFARDLEAFQGEDVPSVFPAWESLPQERSISDSIFGGRLRVLQALHQPEPPNVIVTSIIALMQPVPDFSELNEATQKIKVGDELDLDSFMRWLVEQGCERVSEIELPGEFSLHGGILDVFPPDAEDPYRIELFGDEVDSIRRFDVESQRKVDDATEVALTFVAPVENADSSGDTHSFLNHLPEGSWIAFSELQEMVDEGRHYLERLPNARGLFSVQATIEHCTDLPTVSLSALPADSLEQSCHLKVESIERFQCSGDAVVHELESVLGTNETALVACHNEGEMQRLTELFSDSLICKRVRFCIGELIRGFRLVREQIYVVGDHELFHRTEVRRAVRKKRRHDSRAIESFLDLNEGDLVVHVINGIARFRGMKLLEKEDQVEEHLELEFRESVRVYVPVSLIHLVQKYIGAAKSTPELSKLGTTSWSKKKQRVEDVVTDMAGDMIKLQAKREARPGISLPPDSEWQREFEASFPYRETRDQDHAIQDCKNDLEESRPMDRLICGDVGYGKTEVAMRAAFKCIDAGRQVAVLVPTTVLAEQHQRTFAARMAEYPVTIAGLSRFKTKREQREVLEGMADGTVDLVIGTHRLIQKDIRFKDLGLLIIDEEQRFGVEAKEMLKHLRLEIDVLTLTATPIPRTLHQSLLGIRDISNLTTPPRDRVAIETRICRWDKDLIRNAVVRELNRGGQVYFVHNRVHNIRSIADELQAIVPEANIVIGHGQMSGSELEAAMLEFVTGRADILVATTIIESGVDIPNANTMFIHQADIYGLADLHQLRGRVGRYHHRAYCYLIPSDNKPLTRTATRRLKAIEEYSELGAGFKIAMRDLEIRGAGNILGTEQSGHIASVGYELYCQLLENAVRRMKKLPEKHYFHVSVDLPVSAYFPTTYVPPGRHKIDLYRRLASFEEESKLDEFADELRDRFGPVPDEAMQMIQVRRLQVFARHWTIDDIHLEDGYAVFRYQDQKRIRELEALCGSDLRVVDHKEAYLVLTSDELDGTQLLEQLLRTLRVPDLSDARRKSG